MMVGASSWKDQFVEAFTVQAGKLWWKVTDSVEDNFVNDILAGDDDDEEEGEEGEEGEEKMPTCGDYIMHFLTLVWKVIFALIPPAGKNWWFKQWHTWFSSVCWKKIMVEGNFFGGLSEVNNDKVGLDYIKVGSGRCT